MIKSRELQLSRPQLDGFAQKVEYHPRQWVDASDPLYNE